MPSSKLILIGVITPLSGIFGSLAWPILQRRIGWSDLRMVKLLVALVSLIPLYGCLGFLPVFRKETDEGGAPFGGLTTPGEMYGLAVFFGKRYCNRGMAGANNRLAAGLIYGAFQSYSRSLFSFLIPPGEESRWYGLYSITGTLSYFHGQRSTSLG
jgi:UMF1 family MFS transporter